MKYEGDSVASSSVYGKYLRQKFSTGQTTGKLREGWTAAKGWASYQGANIVVNFKNCG